MPQQTWRDVLKEAISDPHERQRIADVLQVSYLTLGRWANGLARPRQHNFDRLLAAMPAQQALLRQLFEQELEPSFATSIQFDGNLEEIPSAFYATVLHVYGTTPSHMRFWSVCNLVLQQAIKQLDPQRFGMEITIAQCRYQPQSNMIQCLMELIGIGTPPWSESVEQRSLFLGSESFAGFAVSAGHIFINQNLKDSRNLYPVRQMEWEQSAVVCPIQKSHDVAGCLLVSSTQTDYFTPEHVNLIQQYAALCSLAFQADDFYDPTILALCPMPPYRIQKERFSNFRYRVLQVMGESAKQRRFLSSAQAEALVWQQLEDELAEILPVL
jgi:hypothetical protein